MAIIRLLFLFGITGTCCQGALAATITVMPRQTFLRTAPDLIEPPLIIDLSALMLPSAPGDVISLQAIGDYEAPVVRSTLLGVFSSSNVILDNDQLNRVEGAIDAGIDFETESFDIIDPNGSMTDITEDFLITSSQPTFITIPDDANFLFVGVTDTFYADNTDLNGDFAVNISSSVPEPSTFGMAAVLLIGVLAVRRTRKA